MLSEKFLETEREINDGVQLIYKFPNGYGASVIKGPYTYGGDEDLWELAVFKDRHLCYDTEITNDVIGYLNDDAVNSLLERIEALCSEEKDSSVIS